MSKPAFYEIKPKSWEDAKRINKCLKQFRQHYIFRGHASNEWHLKSSLERATEKYRENFSDILQDENQIIEKFISRAHQYIQSPPQNQEIIEWLSIIQHYGGPTRLLDFTESFYVASFFAIETATGDSCVWAINENLAGILINQKNNIHLPYRGTRGSAEFITKAIKFAEEIIGSYSTDKNLVVSIIPSRLNERLATQKGRFLFPCNISNSFEKNICATFDFPFETLDTKNAKLIIPQELENIVTDSDDSTAVVKIVLSKDWHREAIRDLYAMNIDAASLFPGLDGFARSLNFVLREDDEAWG